MTRRFRSAVPLLALMATTTAGAQDVGQPNAQQVPANGPVLTDSAPATAGALRGPTTERAAAGVRVARPDAKSPAPAPPRANTRQNKAMMVVGAAALIVGAIIGNTAGTLFMVGGAVVGLIGLYNYLE